MKKFGILLPDPGANQLAYCAFELAAHVLEHRPGVDVTLFRREQSRPCLDVNVPLMQTAEAWGFDGPLVATDLDSARLLKGFPGCTRRLFLLWDLEWVRGPREYDGLAGVYLDPEFTLLCRGASHAAAMRDCWGREPLVVGDLDPELTLAAIFPGDN